MFVLFYLEIIQCGIYLRHARPRNEKSRFFRNTSLDPETRSPVFV